MESFAKALVMLAQVGGVGYIAMVVSRLTALLAARTAESYVERGDDSTV